MDSDWYYQRKDEVYGPLTLGDLCNELGRLQDWRNEVVWHQSLARWCYAGAVFQLRLNPSLRAVRAAPASGPDQDADDRGRRPTLWTVLALVGLAVVGALSAVLWRWLV